MESQFPNQRLNLCPLQWKRGVNHWTTREIPKISFLFKKKLLFYLKLFQEFRGSPVVRTWCFHCQGPGSVPGQGNKNPTSKVSQQKKKNFFNLQKIFLIKLSFIYNIND